MPPRRHRSVYFSETRASRLSRLVSPPMLCYIAIHGNRAYYHGLFTANFQIYIDVIVDFALMLRGEMARRTHYFCRRRA